MPETTVERMQVEFSTNLSELIASLYTVESKLDSVNDSFYRSETASETYAESMAQAGSAAAASSQGFATLAASMEGIATSSATGAAAAALYANSLDTTQAALTTLSIRMDHTAAKFDDVNAAANGTATAIGRINNISNNAYTTFSRLNTNSTSAAKAIAKLSTETRTLASAYTTATTGTETFTKSIGNVGTATNTVISQINQYSTAISTAGKEANAAAGEMEKVAQKTGETDGAMGKLSGTASKVFSGMMVGTLLDTLDTIIERGMQVSSIYQGISSDISTSLGEITPELTAELNGVVKNLRGFVPASQNDSLAKGTAMLYKYQPEWDTGTYKELMQEYASYAELWGMNLSDLIGTTQRLFTKYNITTEEQMKEALGMINAAHNIAPDATPSSVISILNNNRQAIGAQGWNFEDALSRVVNAGEDRAVSKFQEYLNALQTVKATKADMFASDEEFAAWIKTVTEMVRNAKDETEASNIIKTEFDIRGTSALEIVKYLRLTDSERDRTGEILAKLDQNGSGYTQYLRQETPDEQIKRDESVTSKADKTLGDGMNAIRTQIADKNAYDRQMYDVVSIRLGDLVGYVDKIPVVGEILSPLTGIVKDYIPEINIRKGIAGTPEEFIEWYETRQTNGDYAPFDETYYLAYRKLADQLQVYYDDLQFSGEDAASVRKDLAEGLYTDLMLRVKAAQNGEEVRSLADVTKDVIESTGITIDTATFSGNLQLPDGTILSGADAAAVLNGTQTVAPPEEEEEKSFFDKVGEFFSNLFGSAEVPETATVEGDFAAVAAGDASVSAAGNLMVSAEQAAIVADAGSLAEQITVSPQITVEVTVPYAAGPGTVTYQVPAVNVPSIPAPVLTMPALESAEPSGAQASVGFAMQSMTEALAAHQPVVQPDISLTPSVAVSPSVSVDPQVTVEPEVSADAYLSVPDISVNPSLTVLPQIAVEPLVDVMPLVAEVPDVITTVDAPSMPDITMEPEISVSPLIAEVPDVITTVDAPTLPDIMVEPEISVSPLIAEVPDVITTVDAPSIPDIMMEPEISTYPDISLTPYIPIEPQIAVQVPELEMEPAVPQMITTLVSSEAAPVVIPEMPVMQQFVEQSSPVFDYGDLLGEIRNSLNDLKSVVSLFATMIATMHRDDGVKAGDTSITQNFYAPTVDSYTVRNAASQAVSAAQARACRM